MEIEFTTDLGDPGPRTKIDYIYIDGGNYKFANTVILEGRLTEADLDKIRASLNTDGFFIPSQVGLKDLQSQSGGEWDDEIDHVWHAFEAFSYTSEPATSDTTTAIMMKNWPAASKDWNESAAWDHHACGAMRPALKM